jgi:ribosome maturation factor RimP
LTRNGSVRRKKLTKPIPEIDRELEARIEALSMELVDVEWGGSGRRPVLRIRVDFPDSEPGRGVTVHDCARVSRELEPWLDGHDALPERYVLEVSSPGVERPLKRRRDFERFAGQEVVIRGHGPLGGTGSNRIQGVLEGVEVEGGAGEEFAVSVRTKEGDTVRVVRDEISRANLVFRWEEEG